jgi:hypothetical protein
VNALVSALLSPPFGVDVPEMDEVAVEWDFQRR